MRVPQFKDPELTKYLVEMDREVQRNKRDSMSTISANKSVLLFAPDLSVWEVTITNAGVLQAVKIQG